MTRAWLVSFLSSRTGVSQKLFQYAAARLPHDASAVQGPKPLSVAVVRSLIEERSPRLAQDIGVFFPFAYAASLGQVHQATLRDGRRVAIKVQYPGLARQVRRDLRLLLAAASFGPARRAGFESGAYASYLDAVLASELDYSREASNLEIARRLTHRFNSTNTPRVRIPEPMKEYSGPDLLTMEWMPFEDAHRMGAWAANKPEVRRAFLEDVSGFVLSLLFSEGLLYSDLHSGNIGRCAETGRTCFVDFGVLEPVAPTHVAALHGVIEARLEERSGSLIPYFEALGFRTEAWSALAPRLPALCEAALSPLRGPGLAHADDFDLGARIGAILAEEAWTFRMSGPPWFFGVMRMLGYLCALARGANVSFDMRRGLDEALARRAEGGGRAWAPVSAPKEAKSSSENALPGMAKVLKVALARNGVKVVEIEMPARAVFRLEHLLSEEVCVHIAESGRSVAGLKASLLARGLLPGEVIRELLDDGEFSMVLA